MSIFDGHEDKSPEELAVELGILDSSIADDTKMKAIIEDNEKEINDSLGATNKKNNNPNQNTFLTSTKKLKINGNFDIREIIRSVYGPYYYKIINVESSEITTKNLKTGEIEIYKPSFPSAGFGISKIFFLHDKYVNHPNALHYWTSTYNDKHIIRGTRFKRKISGSSEYESGVIIKVNPNNMISVVFPDQKEEFISIEEFKKNYKIFKPSIIKINYRLAINAGLHNNDIEYLLSYNINQLKVGDFVRENGEFYYIMNIYKEKTHLSNSDDENCVKIEMRHLKGGYNKIKLDDQFVKQYELCNIPFSKYIKYPYSTKHINFNSKL